MQVVNDVEIVQVLDAPAIFGEAALLQLQDSCFSLRTCGFRTATSCRLWYMPTQTLMPLLSARPEVLDLLSQRIWQHSSLAEAPRSRQPSDQHPARLSRQGSYLGVGLVPGGSPLAAHAADGKASDSSSRGLAPQGSIQLVATSVWRGTSAGAAIPVAEEVAAPPGEAPVTRGELQSLRTEVLKLLEFLVQEVQGVAILGRSTSGGVQQQEQQEQMLGG